MRVTSCIPQQLTSKEDKLLWLSRMAKRHKPDIFVTPQEYFGGVVMMPDKPAFRRDELLPDLQSICTHNNMALVVGLVEEDADHKRREVIWFLDRDGSLKGRQVKFALPRYDHVCTKGAGRIVPETDLGSRFAVFEIAGCRVAAMFCWEVYSDLLWTGLGLSQPDVVFSLIKFGVNSWPIIEKRKGELYVRDFGYGSWQEQGRWIERLRVANVWQVKCPIICSTNSWNLRSRSLPLCGTISGIPGQAQEDVWMPTKDGPKQIPEVVIDSEFNVASTHAALQNKFYYKDVVGEFPPYSLAQYTMMLKIGRLERRVLSGREASAVAKVKSTHSVGWFK